MVHDATVQTTKLLAVNRILSALGAPRASGLGSSRTATLVENTLDQVVEELCNEKWWFNTTTQTRIATSAIGWLHLPMNITNLDAEDALDYSDRDRRLYDKRDNTFIHALATNLLAEPFDFTNVIWIKTGSMTVTGDVAQSPAQGVQSADRLSDANAAAVETCSQNVLAANLTDGNEYEFSCYVRHDAGSLAGANFQMGINHTGGVKTGTMALALNTGVLTTTGWIFDAEVLTLDDNWFYLRCKITFDLSDGPATGITMVLTPDSSAGGAAGQNIFAWGAQAIGANTGPFRMILVRLLDFLDLPNAARDYVVRASTRQAHGRLIGTNIRTQELLADESDSLRRLWRAQLLQEDTNVLYSSFSGARFFGRTRGVNSLLSAGELGITNVLARQ